MYFIWNVLWRPNKRWQYVVCSSKFIFFCSAEFVCSVQQTQLNLFNKFLFLIILFSLVFQHSGIIRPIFLLCFLFNFKVAKSQSFIDLCISSRGQFYNSNIQRMSKALQRRSNTLIYIAHIRGIILHLSAAEAVYSLQAHCSWWEIKLFENIYSSEASCNQMS